jgi:tetratricopeptide (TPR) repeat protein
VGKKMREGIFYCFLIVVIMSVVSATDIVCAQPNRSYGGYPYSPNPNFPPIYIANREMMPQSAFFPPSANPANLQGTATPQTPATSVVPTSPTTPFIPEKNTENAEPENKEQTETTKESTINKVKSYFTSLFYSSKNNKSPRETKEKELPENIDDGQEIIEALRKEQDYSMPDYVNSATQSKAATAKDHYKQGLDFEVQGDFTGAVRSYNAFIAANKKQTTNGTLAAPYHRLALIAWKQSEIRNSGVYFRYAMRYALGGNVPIIAGDYALFLMEQNDLKQAEVVLRNALIHYPDNNRLLYYLGRCIANQDKPIEAIRYFSASLGEERAYQELAFLYRQWGDFERAEFLDTKRNEYLAKRNKMIPQQVFASQPTNVNPQQPAALPTTPPPVIPNPHGILSQGTLNPGTRGTPVPFPTFDNPNGQREQAFTNANINTNIPTNDSVKSSVRSSEIFPPYGNRAIPEDSWQPLTPPPSPIPSSVSPMPVSKVFHYPADQTIPTYYEFQGDQYPKNPTNTTPTNTNVIQTSFMP